MIHPRDLPKHELDLALAESDHPDLLRELVDTSHRIFGVHTQHFPHTINYPWTAARLSSFQSGSRFLEIGPGVNPLPFFFATRGMYVDCVDDSDFARTLPAGDDWNEWGFFDYGAHHPNLAAKNLSVVDFQPSHQYQAIYSVSVISLMPSPVREKTLRLCRSWLAPGGKLVLPIDLIAGTDTLWNRGGSNETPEQHGTWRDVESQVRSLGFEVDESRIRRQIRGAPVDLYFLSATSR